jgi:two-component system response regulator DctR
MSEEHSDAEAVSAGTSPVGAVDASAEGGDIHVVDDDPAMRDSLTWLMRSRGLTALTWESGEAFLAGADHARPAAVVLDIRMAGLSGLDVLEELRRRNTVFVVIMLTGHGDVPLAVQSLKQGAADFIEKPFDPNELVDRLVVALAESRRRLGAARAAASVQERLQSLSTREREVMDLVLDGFLNKQIADRLGITMRTVEVHRARLFDKFAVRSAVELAQALARVR